MANPIWSRLGEVVRSFLAFDGDPLWHMLLEEFRPQIVVLSMAKAHLARIEFEPLTDWEVIHSIERTLFIFGLRPQSPCWQTTKSGKLARLFSGSIEMTDKHCFIQFPHPGGEHNPDRNGKIGWNKRYRPHKRKFMRLRGEWIDGSSNRHCGDLLAWGEWEPESDLIRDFKTPDGEPHHPRYLWDPYWVPKNTYRCLHNTDPFIFGDRFLYSNCGQSAPKKCGLKHLDQGSVIAFGSGKKIKDHWTWMLDTVLVVKDSFWYNPLNPRKTLEGKVPDEFLEVTGSPLVAWAEDLRKGAGSAACAPTSERLRLYRGATPDDLVDGMFSFFPAIPADGESCFPRPVVSLDDEYFNPRSSQAPKGAGCNRKSDELRCQWRSLVKQVHRAGLVLGTYAQLPERRVE